MNLAKTIMILAAVSIPAYSGQKCTAKDASGKSVCAVSKAAAGAVKAAPAEAALTTDALATLIRSGVKVTILDARTGKYDDGRRIPGAKALSPSADEATITATAGEKSGLVVTYCANVKCPASKALATRLHALGYTNVLEYPEGIAGWAEAGQKVVTAK